jgi:hypothetical protein
VNYAQLKEKVDVLARHNLDERRIRNTMNTALQLANFLKEMLEYSHFDQTIDVTNKFEDYILKAHGHSDEEWACSENTIEEIEQYVPSSQGWKICLVCPYVTKCPLVLRASILAI